MDSSPKARIYFQSWHRVLIHPLHLSRKTWSGKSYYFDSWSNLVDSYSSATRQSLDLT